MRPVTQTIFGKPHGNCFAACVASILELELDDVPNFCSFGADWHRRFAEWLWSRGLSTLCFKELGDCGDLVPNAYCIASGQAARGLKHSVVWRGGKMVHDPHPDQTGLVGEPEDFVFFVVDDPSEVLQ